MMGRGVDAYVCWLGYLGIRL